MSAEEKIARAFLDWQAEQKQFMADPSPKNLAKLEAAAKRHIDAADSLLREKMRHSSQV